MLDEIGSKMKAVMGSSKAKERMAELGSTKLAKTAPSKDSSERSEKDEKQTVDSETKERQALELHSTVSSSTQPEVLQARVKEGECSGHE
jgi:hypothetical protein